MKYYYLNVLYSENDKLNFRSKINNFFKFFTEEQRVYFIGFILLFCITIFQILLPTFDFLIFYWLILIIMSFEFIKLPYKLSLDLWQKTTLAKILFSMLAPIITTFVVTIVLSESEQWINSILHISPSKFTYTINIISILLIVPFGTLIIFFSGALIFLIISAFFGFSFDQLLSKKYGKMIILTYIFRLLLFFLIFFKTAEIYDNQVQSYNNIVVKYVAQWSTYHLDMYKFSHCKNVKSNEKVAYLHRNYIAIGYIDELGKYHFRVEECEFS